MFRSSLNTIEALSWIVYGCAMMELLLLRVLADYSYFPILLVLCLIVLLIAGTYKTLRSVEGKAAAFRPFRVPPGIAALGLLTLLVALTNVPDIIRMFHSVVEMFGGRVKSITWYERGGHYFLNVNNGSIEEIDLPYFIYLNKCLAKLFSSVVAPFSFFNILIWRKL